MALFGQNGLWCKVLLQMFKKLLAPLSLLSKLNNMAILVAENGCRSYSRRNSIDQDQKGDERTVIDM